MRALYNKFTDGFNRDNTEIDCIDKRDFEGKRLDEWPQAKVAEQNNDDDNEGTLFVG